MLLNSKDGHPISGQIQWKCKKKSSRKVTFCEHQRVALLLQGTFSFFPFGDVKVKLSTALNTSMSEINRPLKPVSVELKPVVSGWTVVIFTQNSKMMILFQPTSRLLCLT